MATRVTDVQVNELLKGQQIEEAFEMFKQLTPKDRMFEKVLHNWLTYKLIHQ